MKFNELRKINVNDHIEKKNGLSYLSWAWAVDTLLSHDPAATWTYDEPKAFGKTLMVFCTVEAFGKKMTAQLPVLDYRNQAIPEPNAMQVNTAMQRCLVKTIALFGIGLYIYAGEDLPTSEIKPSNTNQMTPIINKVDELIALNQLKEVHELLNTLQQEEKVEIWKVLSKETKAMLQQYRQATN